MTAFVMLQMFKEQGSRSASTPRLESSAKFADWKVGYLVMSKGSRELFTIKEIHSADGAMHYQDCQVVLINAAGETRMLRGATLQSGYEFSSKGDVKDEPDTETSGRKDCTSIVLNVAGIREFYPRKRGEGTRILMQDKTAYIVADDFTDVHARIKQAVAESMGHQGSSGLRVS